MKTSLFVVLALTASYAAAADYFLTPRGIQQLSEDNIDISYDASLTCSQCIRGGYLYCGDTTQFDGKCCELTNPLCIIGQFKQCMDSMWKNDEFNSLFNFCGRLQAKATCGNATINIDSLGNKTEMTIEALKFGESCTYGIVSKCGYPKIEIDRTDLDVVVASIPKFSDIKFNSSTFDLKQFGKDMTRALNKTKDVVKGKFEYVFGKGTKQVVNETCGDDRTILVTITNLNKNTLAQGNAVQARMLADATATKIGMTFSSTSVPDSAFTLFVSTISLIVVSLAVLF